MPEGGTLTLTAAPLDVSEHAPPIPLTSDYAVLTIEDDGIGMTPAVRERIFDPFFTTKDEGRGSGLGLATVYASVRRMGGHVEVDSEAGRGTKLTLYLPLASRRAVAETGVVARRLPIDAESGEVRPLTVLIAADDPLSRRAVRRLTRRAGYEARAFDQNEAREILEAHILSPDVVVFDPEGSQSGTEGVERIVAAAGDAPVVLLTAYITPEDEASAIEAGVAVVVRKPVGAKELKGALLAALVGSYE
jgi:CheY-like chemotaxis protein